MNNIRQVIRIFVFYKPEIKKQCRQRLILRRGTYLVFHCKFRQVLSISKNWLFAIFSRLRRVVTRWIIASYNIEFLKLPLKTEVFRGSLFIDLCLSKKFLPSILRQKVLYPFQITFDCFFAVMFDFEACRSFF